MRYRGTGMWFLKLHYEIGGVEDYVGPFHQKRFAETHKATYGPLGAEIAARKGVPPTHQLMSPTEHINYMTRRLT